MTTQTAIDLITPGDAGWDAARTPWHLLADQRPALVAQPSDAADVAEAVRYARTHGLRVVAQGTGHGAYALGPLDDTLLLRTGRMTDIVVDPRERTAGAHWSDVLAAVTP